MTRGRKPQVTALVQRLEGSDMAKARLAMFLEALAGKQTAVEAALGLGLSERRFHRLRNLCMQAALTSLEPRPMGRPSRRLQDQVGQLAALEIQVQTLRLDLRAAQIREEIAVAMPHLRQRSGRSKTGGRSKARKPEEKGGGSSGCVPSDRRTQGSPSDAAARQASETCVAWSETSAETPSPSPDGRYVTASPTPKCRSSWAFASEPWHVGRSSGDVTDSACGPEADRRNDPTGRCGAGRWRYWVCWVRGPASSRCKHSVREWHVGNFKTCSAAIDGRGVADGGCSRAHCTGLVPARSGRWTSPNRRSPSRDVTVGCWRYATWPAACNCSGSPCRTNRRRWR